MFYDANTNGTVILISFSIVFVVGIEKYSWFMYIDLITCYVAKFTY